MNNRKNLIGVLLALVVVLGGVYLYLGTDLSGSQIEGAYGRPCSSGNCVKITTTGPSAGTYSAGQNDLELFGLSFQNTSSSTSVDISQLVFNLNSTGGGLLDSSGANYSDIKLVDSTGAVLAGPVSLSTTGFDSLQTLTFVDKWSIARNSTKTAMLTVDISGTGSVVTGDTLYTNLRIQNIIASWTSGATFILTSQVNPQFGVSSKTQTAL